ncbi:MAG: hypothetical protein GWP08_06570 [Nitrospiraceae bacterium]|nr:hypothetical protein [Nitrospiraceae bacterium]
MIFVKTFKGYEDKTSQIDAATNAWILANNVDVRAVEVVLSHEQGSRAGSGDLLFTVLYKADEPIP